MRRPVIIVVVLAMFVSGLAVIIAAVVGGPANRDGTKGRVPTPTPTSTARSDATVERAPTPISLGCPAPRDGRTRGVRLRVVRWCAFPGVRNQAQVKMRVTVVNESRRVQQIDRARFRLLVPSGRGRWSPPRRGEQTEQRPFDLERSGQRFRAFPSNPNAAFDVVPGTGGLATFASFWYGDELAPGAKSSSSERYQNVLAFYVPLPEQTGTLPPETAVALMDGRKIVVACPFERWGPRVAADEV